MYKIRKLFSAFTFYFSDISTQGKVSSNSYDSEEPFEEGFNDAVSASVVRIMSKIPTQLIRRLLRFFDVRVYAYTPRMLATALLV